MRPSATADNAAVRNHSARSTGDILVIGTLMGRTGNRPRIVPYYDTRVCEAPAGRAVTAGTESLQAFRGSPFSELQAGKKAPAMKGYRERCGSSVKSTLLRRSCEQSRSKLF